MADLTRHEVLGLREASKNDRAIIVGSEVRQLCDMALRYLEQQSATVPTTPPGFPSYAKVSKDLHDAMLLLKRMAGVIDATPAETYKDWAMGSPLALVEQYRTLASNHATPLAAAPAASEQEPECWYRFEQIRGIEMRVYYETKCWPDLIPLYAAPQRNTSRTEAVAHDRGTPAESQGDAQSDAGERWAEKQRELQRFEQFWSMVAPLFDDDQPNSVLRIKHSMWTTWQIAHLPSSPMNRDEPK